MLNFFWVLGFPQNFLDFHCLLHFKVVGCQANVVGLNPLLIFPCENLSASSDNNNNDSQPTGGSCVQ